MKRAHFRDSRRGSTIADVRLNIRFGLPHGGDLVAYIRVVSIKLSLAIPMAAFLLASLPTQAATSGAIFTTVSDGSIVNANHYQSKCDVYLNGGPGPNAPATAAGLPNGDYYFQVTDPSGNTLLSTDPVSNRRFQVSGGLIVAYNGTGGPVHSTGISKDHGAQGAITVRAANINCPTDYLDTPNPGNTYKVWATPVASFVGDPAKVDNACAGSCSHGFVHNASKTDNFQALSAPTATFCLSLQKQFLSGANISPDLLGWGISVLDPLGVTNSYTTDTTSGQVTTCQLPLGTYTVTEDATGPTGACFLIGPNQTTVNGIVQPTAGTATFAATSTSPVTVVFLNAIACKQ